MGYMCLRLGSLFLGLYFSQVWMRVVPTKPALDCEVLLVPENLYEEGSEPNVVG
ncbi:hypothetical protein Scep_006804 [Stephania cephalantha]|uniref:Uncharacterized protein n=1 Tax=Stephania cephalantha TaxID=152367 RepID=A0AAP0K8U2_9MAGN